LNTIMDGYSRHVLSGVGSTALLQDCDMANSFVRSYANQEALYSFPEQGGSGCWFSSEFLAANPPTTAVLNEDGTTTYTTSAGAARQFNGNFATMQVDSRCTWMRLPNQAPDGNNPYQANQVSVLGIPLFATTPVNNPSATAPLVATALTAYKTASARQRNIHTYGTAAYESSTHEVHGYAVINEINSNNTVYNAPLISPLIAASRTLSSGASVNVTYASPAMILTLPFRQSDCLPAAVCSACNNTACRLCGETVCWPVCQLLDPATQVWRNDAGLTTQLRWVAAENRTVVDCVLSGISSGTVAVFAGKYTYVTVTPTSSSSTGPNEDGTTDSSSSSSSGSSSSSSSSSSTGGNSNSGSSGSSSSSTGSSFTNPTSPTGPVNTAVRVSVMNGTITLNIPFSTASRNLTDFRLQLISDLARATGVDVDRIIIFDLLAVGVASDRTLAVVYVIPSLPGKNTNGAVISLDTVLSNITAQVTDSRKSGPFWSGKLTSQTTTTSWGVGTANLLACSDGVVRAECNNPTTSTQVTAAATNSNSSFPWLYIAIGAGAIIIFSLFYAIYRAREKRKQDAAIARKQAHAAQAAEALSDDTGDANSVEAQAADPNANMTTKAKVSAAVVDAEKMASDLEKIKIKRMDSTGILDSPPISPLNGVEGFTFGLSPQDTNGAAPILLDSNSALMASAGTFAALTATAGPTAIQPDPNAGTNPADLAPVAEAPVFADTPIAPTAEAVLSPSGTPKRGSYIGLFAPNSAPAKVSSAAPPLLLRGQKQSSRKPRLQPAPASMWTSPVPPPAPGMKNASSSSSGSGGAAAAGLKGPAVPPPSVDKPIRPALPTLSASKAAQMAAIHQRLQNNNLLSANRSPTSPTTALSPPTRTRPTPTRNNAIFQDDPIGL